MALRARVHRRLDQAPPPVCSIRHAWSAQRWALPSWVRYLLPMRVSRRMLPRASCPACVRALSLPDWRNCSGRSSRPPLSGTIPCTHRNNLAATAVAKRLRRHASLLAKKAGEMRRVGKSKIVSDLMDRLVGEYKLPLGFGENALPDEMTRSDTGRAFDMVIETVGRHRK